MHVTKSSRNEFNAMKMMKKDNKKKRYKNEKINKSSTKRSNKIIMRAHYKTSENKILSNKTVRSI